MTVDTNSVTFKSRLLNELFKNDIDYDTAVVLLDCIKSATKLTVLLELVALKENAEQ